MGRLRVPWTNQPQTAVGIDSSNPITRGLVFALNAANRRDSISGATAVLSGTSYQAVGLAGISHKSPTTQVPGAFTYTVNIASAFDCTTIAVFRSVTAQAATASVPTLNFNSAEPVLFSSTGSQSVFSTTGNASTAITTLSAGRVYVLAGVKRGNSQEQYVNGVKVTTNITGNRAVGAITTVSVGGPSGWNNFENAEYYEVLHFNRALSPHEVAVLSANPWQVFAPLQRNSRARAASGGGMPTLTVSDAAHGHTADNLVLTSSTDLVIAEATHGHAADNLTLDAPTGTSLTVADATHAHTADALTLSTDAWLTVADALHAHAADNLALTLDTWLVVADALHVHAVDNLDLSGAPALVIADALHAHAADNLALTLDTWLAIQDAVHAHTADNISLGDTATITGPGRARIGTTVLHKARRHITFKAPSKRIGAPTL